MSETIADLIERMEAASRALDFEEARRLRDRIALIRGGANSSEAEHADDSGIVRQTLGAMGLGTGQVRVSPPNGWRPPKKPDPGTTGKSRRRR